MKESMTRILDSIEEDKRKDWLEAGKPQKHTYVEIKKLRKCLKHPVVHVVVSQYRGLFDEDPKVFWDETSADLCVIDDAERLDIPIIDGHPDLDSSDNYINSWVCEIRDSTWTEEIERLRDRKCAVPGCFNYHEPGIIYCVTHMHGAPRKMSESEIAKLKAAFPLGLGVK